MEWIIIAIIVIVITVIVITVSIVNGTSSSQTSNIPNENYYTSGYNNIGLEKRKGFTKYQMVGMYYRKLNKADMGKFEGYAKADKYNAHDPFAVSIFNNMGKHVGYLPAGNKYIYKLLLENNQSLPVYGYISCDKYGNNYIGEVAIKTNTALNTDNLFYDQSITIIGKFNITQKELAEILRQMGANISNSIHEHTDIALIGDKIKGTKVLEKLELLINQGCNIRKIYRDELEKILEDGK